MKPTEMLLAYLDAPDAAYSWAKIDDSAPFTRYELVSQIWQRHLWRHPLWHSAPEKPLVSGLAVLYVTGDEVIEADWPFVKLLEQVTGLPVFGLFNVPHQPIFDMREDDLIAHSFEQYLETDDPSWPLLFPMTKAVIRAMDAAQEIGFQEGKPIDRFIVVGASKRGWTTWLAAGSGDPRIAAIVPMVFDNLRMDVQMRQQVEYWGQYSPMLDDYTRRALQAMLEHSKGIELSHAVDPYSFLDRIKCQKLSISGANDPFWTVDAIRSYWDEVPGPKSTLFVPNAGHGMGDGQLMMRAIGALAFYTASQRVMPAVTMRVQDGDAYVSVTGEGSCLRMWAAESPNRDFSAEPYQVFMQMTNPSEDHEEKITLPGSRNYQAIIAEVEFEQPRLRHSLTSLPVLISPKG